MSATLGISKMVNDRCSGFLRGNGGPAMLVLLAGKVKLLSDANKRRLFDSLEDRRLKSMLRSGGGYEAIHLNRLDKGARTADLWLHPSDSTEIRKIGTVRLD